MKLHRFWLQAMKFRQGYLISTGEPKRHYISEAVRHVQMRQGTIGIKVAWFSHFKLRYPSEFPLFTSVHLPGMYNDVYNIYIYDIYKILWSLARWAKLKHVFLTFSILFCLFGGWHSLLPVERHYLKKIKRCRARCILSSDCAFACICQMRL